jgi:hypothetical protein
MKIDVNDIDFHRDRNAILDEFHKRYQAVNELKMRCRIA